MTKRSLQASSLGIQQAKRAFSLKGWTQENLAGEVNLKTRQPIWRFFTGKPVDRQVFLSVCSILDLDWREIAVDPPAEFPALGEVAENISMNIDGLVQQVRSQHQGTIQNQCGILQLLDINRPVNIDDIYVDVNILEDIPSQQQLEIADLQKLEPADLDWIGSGSVEHHQSPGMQVAETYPKLRVLGKPGVGKTTFLQHLAIQCDRGEFAADQVPIFIVLREFAAESRRTGEFNLFNYIHQDFLNSGISNPSAIEPLLQAGKVLLLLDGMDEVLNQDITAVLKEIRKFSDSYYKNRFVVSCRTAARKLQLRGFTDVEIAPFSQAQIATFAKKWFVSLTKTTADQGREQAEQFMQKLDQPENCKFRQLAVTPLFLHLICWVFQGQGQFPTKRTEFYKQGIDLLLNQWDEARGVERDDVCQGFLLPQKLRLLSHLAAVTFEQGQYFFDQRTLEHYIADYLHNLPETVLEPEELQLESEAILNAIETQHGLLIERARGIFSFSCLAFQEYFTARKIVAGHNLRETDQSLCGLVSHIINPHWREVFLLTAAMLRNADSLVQLMKQQIDALGAQDPYLQKFLSWANQKSQRLPEPTKVTATHEFYVALADKPSLSKDFALPCTLDKGVFLDIALENMLLECTMGDGTPLARTRDCSAALNKVLVMVLDARFYKSLQQLKEQLPSASENRDRLQNWWQTSYEAWVQQLKEAIAHYRNIHYSWQFTPEQQQTLQRYYDASQLLVDCLNSNCEITAAIREEIEATLLLPQKKLEDREWQCD